MALGWLWWRAWVLLGRRGCLRGKRGAWQAWRLATSTFTLRGRCGTWCGRHGTYGTGLVLAAFVTHNSFTHTTLSHISCTHTQLCHTFLSRTTLSHISFTHNLVTHTHNSFTQLCHTHTQLFHTRNFVTHNSFTRNFVTYPSFTRNTFTYTNLHAHTHTTLPHTALLPNPACTISFIFPVFPISFSHLLGDYWKKLTCGVIRSFNFLIYIKYSPPVIFWQDIFKYIVLICFIFFQYKAKSPAQPNAIFSWWPGSITPMPCHRAVCHR